MITGDTISPAALIEHTNIMLFTLTQVVNGLTFWCLLEVNMLPKFCTGERPVSSQLLILWSLFIFHNYIPQ